MTQSYLGLEQMECMFCHCHLKAWAARAAAAAMICRLQIGAAIENGCQTHVKSQ